MRGEKSPLPAPPREPEAGLRTRDIVGRAQNCSRTPVATSGAATQPWATWARPPLASDSGGSADVPPENVSKDKGTKEETKEPERLWVPGSPGAPEPGGGGKLLGLGPACRKHGARRRLRAPPRRGLSVPHWR